MYMHMHVHVHVYEYIYSVMMLCRMLAVSLEVDSASGQFLMHSEKVHVCALYVSLRVGGGQKLPLKLVPPTWKLIR